MHIAQLRRRRLVNDFVRTAVVVCIGAVAAECADNAPTVSSPGAGTVLFNSPFATVLTQAKAPRAFPDPPGEGRLRRAFVCASSCADSVVIDFEGTVDGVDSLFDYYAGEGVVFDGVLVVNVPHYNSFDYPPRSGTTVALANVFRPTNTIQFTLDEDAVLVRGFFTANAPVELDCYNAANQHVGGGVFPGGNLGRTGLPTNQPLEVAAPGIRWCQIVGPLGTYSLEDLTIRWHDRVAAELKLDCGGSQFVRASEIVCLARMNPPPQTFQIQSWSFTPEGSATPTLREGTTSTDTVWAGIVVAPGVVSVSAVANGQALAASQHVAITARDWSALVANVSVVDSVPTGLPTIPTKEAELGRTDLELFFAGHALSVASGPNTGYFYFTDIPLQGKVSVRINKPAFDPVGELARMQHADTSNGLRHCAPSEIPGLEQIVRAHEGIPPTAAVSHARVTLDTINGKGRALFEAYADTAVPPVQDMRHAVHLAATAASNRVDTTNRAVFPCTVRYRTGQTPPGN